MEACPCCGYRTLYYAQGSFETCPICLWTDDGSLPYEPSEANNDETLASAQEMFVQHGCVFPEEQYQARAPTPQDSRPKGWQTLKEKINSDRIALISKIQSAFADVHLEDGISINMAEYEDSTNLSRLEAAKRDESRNWQLISDELLSRSPSALSFMDWKGFRFSIPAYMVFALKYFDTPPFDGNQSISHSIFHLKPNSYICKKVPFDLIFTAAQQDCMIEFLQFFSQECLDWYPKVAQKNHALFIEHRKKQSKP